MGLVSSQGNPLGRFLFIVSGSLKRKNCVVENYEKLALIWIEYHIEQFWRKNSETVCSMFGIKEVLI